MNFITKLINTAGQFFEASKEQLTDYILDAMSISVDGNDIVITLSNGEVLKIVNGWLNSNILSVITDNSAFLDQETNTAANNDTSSESSSDNSQESNNVAVSDSVGENNTDLVINNVNGDLYIITATGKRKLVNGERLDVNAKLASEDASVEFNINVNGQTFALKIGVDTELQVTDIIVADNSIVKLSITDGLLLSLQDNTDALQVVFGTPAGDIGFSQAIGIKVDSNKTVVLPINNESPDNIDVSVNAQSVSVPVDGLEINTEQSSASDVDVSASQNDKNDILSLMSQSSGAVIGSQQNAADSANDQTGSGDNQASLANALMANSATDSSADNSEANSDSSIDPSSDDSQSASAADGAVTQADTTVIPITPFVSLATNIVSIDEQQEYVTLTVNLSAQTTRPVTVEVTVSGGSASRFDTTVFEIVVPAGSDTAELVIDWNSNFTREASDSVSIAITDVLNGMAETSADSVSFEIVDEAPIDASNITEPTDITGGELNDSLSGGSAGDTLSAGAGDDTVSGGQGNDIVDGGTGNDMVSGGEGNDTTTGGAGNDSVSGDAGDDTTEGGDGDDTVDGGTGNDTVSGGEGNDTTTGGAGNDSVSGDAGDDTTEGGDGDDTVDGGTGNDTVSGGEGNDTTTGGAGNDSVSGDAGDDTTEGGDGDDTVDGGTGNDTVSGGDGNDTTTGGAGNDSVSGDAGDDTTEGGDGDDTVDGGTGNDTVSGGEGNDTTTGGAGNDSVSGDAGDDTTEGGDGDDTVDGGTGNDTVSGGEGNDTTTGGAGNDSVSGDAGDDTD